MRDAKNRSISSIVRSLGKLSRRWLKRKYSFRRKAVHRLIQRSHFSQNMAEALLDALFAELTAPKLIQLLKSEIKDPLVLDGFRRDPVSGNFHRANGPRLITHIFSGNVPNPAIVSFILGMLVKSTNVGKVSSEDLGFLDIYLQSLMSHDKRLGRTNFLLRPKDKKSLRRWMRASDLVVAYGSDETLARLKKNVPAKASFAGYGHRVSFGIYAKEVLTEKNLVGFAKKTARDIWMTDQRGCLSPTEIFLEGSKEELLAEFSGALAKEIERLFVMRTWRLPVRVDAAHVIGLAGRKMVRVRMIKDLENIPKILMPIEKYLQAMSLEASAKRRKALADRLSVIGVNRICRAGQMQKPPITWHHDGKPNLAAWLTWTDLEE